MNDDRMTAKRERLKLVKPAKTEVRVLVELLVEG